MTKHANFPQVIVCATKTKGVIMHYTTSRHLYSLGGEAYQGETKL